VAPVQARSDGKRAYLVRDKLYIDNVLFAPLPPRDLRRVDTGMDHK
jgi:hypothetical protein